MILSREWLKLKESELNEQAIILWMLRISSFLLSSTSERACLLGQGRREVFGGGNITFLIEDKGKGGDLIKPLGSDNLSLLATLFYYVLD